VGPNSGSSLQRSDPPPGRRGGGEQGVFLKCVRSERMPTPSFGAPCRVGRPLPLWPPLGHTHSVDGTAPPPPAPSGGEGVGARHAGWARDPGGGVEWSVVGAHSAGTLPGLDPGSNTASNTRTIYHTFKTMKYTRRCLGPTLVPPHIEPWGCTASCCGEVYGGGR